VSGNQHTGCLYNNCKTSIHTPESPALSWAIAPAQPDSLLARAETSKAAVCSWPGHHSHAAQLAGWPARPIAAGTLVHACVRGPTCRSAWLPANLEAAAAQLMWPNRLWCRLQPACRQLGRWDAGPGRAAIALAAPAWATNCCWCAAAAVCQQRVATARCCSTLGRRRGTAGWVRWTREEA
jgi:hypothetical protein